MGSNSLSRRKFLALSAGVGSAAVAACAAPVVPATEAPVVSATEAPVVPATEAPVDAAAQLINSYGKDSYATVAEWEKASGKKLTFQESPAMKALVDAGKIPPLKDRLPEQPVVILPHSPDKKVGRYGDTIYMSSAGGLYGGTNEFTGGLVMEHSYTKGLHPNIWLSYEPQNGGIEWLIKLRKGLKWSDGTPYTTQDVRFWYEDIVLNKELSPNLMDQMRGPSGNPVKMEFMDDYTFKFIFEGPFTLEENVHMLGLDPCWHAKHYLKQFHPNYQDKATLDKMVKDGKFETWMQLINDRIANGDWTGAGFLDMPTLAPWVAVQGKPNKQIIYKPNPYYYAVDAVGNQLPYMDMVVEEMEDAEVAKLKTLNAELDFAMFFSVGLYPTAKEMEQEGKIKVARWGHSATNGGMIEFNLTTADPVLGPLFRDKNFRFGVSHAIDRNTVINLNYYDLLQPQQSGWSKNSEFYDANLLNTAIEFDADKANSFLDKAGLDKKDKDGLRLRSDGKRLELNFLTRAGDHEKDLGIYIDNLNAVGLYATVKVLDWGALSEARKANKLEVVYDPYNWGTNEGAYYQAQSLGVPYGRGWWGQLWNNWYTSGGKEGQEPIPEILQVIDAYNNFNTTIDPAERKAAMKTITTIATENLWTIGSFNHPGYTVVYNAKVQNMPTDFVAWRRGEFGRPQVWFKE